MSNLHKMYKTNPDLEESGVWFEVAPGVRFCMARMGVSNKKFMRCREAKLKPHRSQIDRGTMDSDLLTKIATDAFLETILMDWEGVTDEAGNEMEFSRENAEALFEELPDLLQDLVAEAQNVANFLADEKEALGKSSRNTSDGNNATPIRKTGSGS